MFGERFETPGDKLFDTRKLGSKSAQNVSYPAAERVDLRLARAAEIVEPFEPGDQFVELFPRSATSIANLI